MAAEGRAVVEKYRLVADDLRNQPRRKTFASIGIAENADCVLRCSDLIRMTDDVDLAALELHAAVFRKLATEQVRVPIDRQCRRHGSVTRLDAKHGEIDPS